MSNEEIITPIKVVYDVQGVDRSIRSSQRLLYAMNALRLSVEDFKRLSSDPSLGNLLWMGIQLTRTWRLLYNLVTATNKAQRAGIAQGVGGLTSQITMSGAAIPTSTWTASGAFGVRRTGGAATASLWQTIMGLAGMNIGLGIPLGAPVAIAAAVGGLLIYDMRQRRIHEEWQKHQREVAKSQGLEI